MNAVLNSSQFQSPFTYLSNLSYFLAEKMTKKKLKEACEMIDKVLNIEIKSIEEWNKYNTFSYGDLEEIEEEIGTYKTVNELFKTVLPLISKMKSNISEDSRLYNDHIHFSNKIHELSDTISKKYQKLEWIHSNILTKNAEDISVSSLEEIWEGEDELWDNFYKESTAS